MIANGDFVQEANSQRKGRVRDTSGWDNDGGYALRQRWL